MSLVDTFFNSDLSPISAFPQLLRGLWTTIPLGVASILIGVLGRSHRQPYPPLRAQAAPAVDGRLYRHHARHADAGGVDPDLLRPAVILGISFSAWRSVIWASPLCSPPIRRKSSSRASRRAALASSRRLRDPRRSLRDNALQGGAAAGGSASSSRPPPATASRCSRIPRSPRPWHYRSF